MQPYVVFPQYNSAAIDSNRKEYETQVSSNNYHLYNNENHSLIFGQMLQLSINSTDESQSSGHRKMDFHPRRNHVFPLAHHDVSYFSGKSM